jgi:hypothetical protein
VLRSTGSSKPACWVGILLIAEVGFAMDSPLEGLDSNFRSPVRKTAFSRLPVRITRPSCYAAERSAEHRTPAGAGELGGHAKEPASVKGELRGIERGPKKLFLYGFESTERLC